MKRTKTFFGLLWLLMAVCLSGCSGDSGASSGKLVGKYKPILNPHPKYFVTVKGRIDPSLIPQKHLLLTMRYYGANRQCNYVINQFEGVSASRTADFQHEVKFNPNGDFSYKVALDRYLPSFCQWSAYKFQYTAFNRKGGEAFSSWLVFNDSKKFNPKKMYRDDWVCGKECVPGKISHMLNTYGTPRRQSYQFIVNASKRV